MDYLSYSPNAQKVGELDHRNCGDSERIRAESANIVVKAIS
jgi:hypothetical protein